MTPPARWTADELERRALLEQGIAVAVNMRRHGNLIAWAKERGPFVRVDRASQGQPQAQPRPGGGSACCRSRWRCCRPAIEPIA